MATASSKLGSTALKKSLFGVFLVHIQSKCGKIRTRKTLNTDTFHAGFFYSVHSTSYSEHSIHITRLSVKLTIQMWIIVV